MAAQLLKAGYVVRGYDVRADNRPRLEAEGGTWAVTPAAAAAEATLLIVMVATAEQADTALFGPGGAVGGLAPGATVILSATVAPDDARALEQRLEECGHLFLDAPVSGGVVGAEAGALSIMASGRPAALAAAQPALSAMAETVYRLGERAGIGSTVVNQLLAGVHIAAAAEAMALGVRAGADAETLFDVITHSAGTSWMFQNRVPHMIAGDDTPLSAVDIFVKDLGIVLDAGRGLQFPLPIAAVAYQMFLAAAGWGRLDDSAVVKVYERLAGIAVAKPSATRTPPFAASPATRRSQQPGRGRTPGPCARSRTPRARRRGVRCGPRWRRINRARDARRECDPS